MSSLPTATFKTIRSFLAAKPEISAPAACSNSYLLA